mmetsp:Transcript_10341/g.18230  ORF Transcript_10341/g.18230 Transcript_10341/m.18230 type:complete len:229 (-) Transcript_10341:639-1325(-)
MVHTVRRSNVGKKCLSSADVGGGLFTTNKLFASLEGHAKCAFSLRVLRNADKTSRHEALKLVLYGHVGCVGTAVEHGNSKALRRADDNVCSVLSWGLDHGARKQVSGHDQARFGAVESVSKLLVVARYRSEGIGVLHEYSAELGQVSAVFQKGFGLSHYNFNAKPLSTGLYTGDGLGVASLRNKEFGALSTGDGVAHVHSFCGGRALVKKRAVCDIHAGKAGHHSLEV